MKILLLLLLSVIGCIPLWAQEQSYTDLTHIEIDSIFKQYYSAGNYAEAARLQELGREKARRELGERDSLFAAYSTGLALMYGKMGNYKKAVEIHRQAKEAYIQALGETHPDFAIALNNFALAYKGMGEYEKALPLLLQSRDIRERAKGREHPSFAKALNNLASLYFDMGAYDKAIPLLIESKAIRERTLGREHPDFAESLNNLAVLYEKTGQHDKALPLYLEARHLREQLFGKNHPLFAQALYNLASLYREMGNEDQALSLYIEAKNILERTLGPEHPSFAQYLISLASFYAKSKKYTQAEELLLRAKTIREASFGKEHAYFAEVLKNLAGLYKRQAKYQKAKELYERVVPLAKKRLGPDHPNYAIALESLALLQEKLGNYDEALELYKQVKSIRARRLGEEHYAYASVLNNLARLHLAKKQYVQAWSFLQQALYKASEQEMAKDLHPDWCQGMAEADYRSNAYIKEVVRSLDIIYDLLAKERGLQSMEQQRRIAKLVMKLLAKYGRQLPNQQDKLSLLAKTNIWLLKSLKSSSPKEHAAEAFQLVDNNKSVLLLQTLQQEDAYALGNLPDSLTWKSKYLYKRKDQLETRLLERQSEQVADSLRSLLNDVDKEMASFVKMVEERYPKYHALTYQEPQIKVETLQGLLDEQTALIEYQIADSILHIFRIDQQEVRWHQVPIQIDSLSANIAAFHASISDYNQIYQEANLNYQRYTSLAYWFYQKLLHPVLEDADKLQNLIIITDKELGHLPFESFLRTAAPTQMDYRQLHYLLKDFNISYSYSATLWAQNKNSPSKTNNGKLFALAANHSIGKNTESSPITRQIREGLQDLPAARKEVEVLQEHYEGFFGFDSLATERIVRNKVADYAFLHFATHGLLDEKRPTLSALVLTEDNDSLFDNFWRAHEISKIELNAELVVLSACETGYGRFETGNGIASLARSFMYAGVPALVVALWQVNDKSTSQLMQGFYKNLSEGMDKAQALRQAKLDYISQAKSPIEAHPAFWSPFILMGDAKPVDLGNSGMSYWSWLALGSALLFAVFLALRWRKRSKRGEDPS